MSLPPPAAYGTMKAIERLGKPERVVASAVDVGAAATVDVGVAGAAPPHAPIVNASTDIAQFRQFTTPQHFIDYETKQNRNIGRVEAVKKPTIAMIRGYAVGGGANIALACDLRIAATDAKLGVPIAKTLGNTVSIATLARIMSYVGPARTKELLFTARLIGAEEGKAAGVFNEVVEPERLEARTMELAEQIAANAPLTIRSVKEGVRRLLEHGRIEEAEDLVLMAYMSDDFREGVEAFLAKRAPN